MRLRSASFALLPLALLSLAACGDDEPARAATATAGDAFCTGAVALDTKSDAMNAQDPFTMSPEDLERGIDELVADNERLAAIAPTDIQAKVQEAVTHQKELVALLEKAGWDFAAAAGDAEFLDVAQEQSAVSAELDAYVLEKCGVDIEADDGTDDSSDDTVPAGLITRDNFLDFYAMGAGIEISDEVKACFLDGIADISDEELNAVLSGTGTEAATMAIGTALLECGVPINQG